MLMLIIIYISHIDSIVNIMLYEDMHIHTHTSVSNVY
jgi:hypothetical protein